MADFNEEYFRQVSEALLSLNDNLRKTGDPLLDFRNDIKKNSDATKNEAKRRQEQADAIKNFTAKTLSFAQQINAGQGSFTSLNTVVDLTAKGLGNLASMIPLAGGFLKGAVEGLGEATKMMVEQFDKAYGVFEQLSDVGVVRNFEQLQQVSAATGMNFADVNKVLGKNSKELAKFGSSVLDGRRMFEDVAAQSQEMRKEFQRIGVTTSEFNDYQLSYMQRLQMTGQLEGKNAQDVAQGTAKYIEQLDALAKLTGQSRKEIQNELDARMRDARYRAAIADMSPEQKAQMDNLMTLLPKSMSEGMKDLIASGGAATTEASKALVANYGDTVLEVSTRIREGSMPVNEAFNKMISASKDVEARNRGLAKVIGNQTLITSNYTDQADLANKKNIENLDDMAKEAEKQRKTTIGTNASLSDTKQQLYNASKNIEQLATNSEIAAKAMDYFSAGVEKVTDLINTHIARMGGTPVERAQHYRNREAQAAAGQGIMSRLFGSSTVGLSQQDLVSQYGLKLKEGNVQKQNGAVNPKLLKLAKQVQDQMSGFSYFSAFNDNYNRESGSKHPQGLAMDFVLNYAPTREQGQQIVQQLKAMGASYAQDEYNDPSPRSTGNHIHAEVQAYRGGLTRGPYSGFPATLHGNELIKPLEPNSILEKLAKTPANMLTNAMGMMTGESTNVVLKDVIKTLESAADQQISYLQTMTKTLTDMKAIQTALMRRTYA